MHAWLLVRHNLKPCSQSSAADRAISSRLPCSQYHTLLLTHTTYTLRLTIKEIQNGHSMEPGPEATLTNPWVLVGLCPFTPHNTHYYLQYYYYYHTHYI